MLRCFESGGWQGHVMKKEGRSPWVWLAEEGVAQHLHLFLVIVRLLFHAALWDEKEDQNKFKSSASISAFTWPECNELWN